MNVNVVPPMTHPLGQYWKQPAPSAVLLDDTHALMSQRDFESLPEYSATMPSGVYPGKTWRAQWRGRWFFRWYGECDDPTKCTNNQREVIVV